MPDTGIEEAVVDESPEAEAVTKKTRKTPVKRAQPHKPEGVKKPMDHQEPAKTAAQREAEAEETVEFTFRDVEFVMPASVDEIPGSVSEALEMNRISNGLRTLFGPKIWGEYRATEPKVKHDRELYNIVAKEYGFGTVGE